MNGLAIVIFMAQLSQFKIFDGAWLSCIPMLVMVGFVLLTMLIIRVLPMLTERIPASLADLIVVSGLMIRLDRHTYRR